MHLSAHCPWFAARPSRFTSPNTDADLTYGGAGGHVLHVEDDPLVAMGTSAVLWRLGYVVTTASGWCEALGALREAAHTFDVVLLDLTCSCGRRTDCNWRAR